MRAIWSGGISFGLIYIPVKLYNASRRNYVDFDLFRKKDMCPIGYMKVCKTTGEEVESEEIVRAFEFEKGEYVVIEDEEIEKADPEKSKSIKIQNFVGSEEIDSKYFEKPYYIEPEKNAEETYALLLEALKKSGKAGIAKFVLRNREHLCVLKPEANYLLLNQMRFASEMLDTAELAIPKQHKASEEELKMAVDIIENMSKPFDPQKYKDTYYDEMMAIIKEKAIHKKITPKGKAPKVTKVKDLMSQLKKSLELAKAN